MGSSAERTGPVMASALMRPARTCGSMEVKLLNIIWIWPDARSNSAAGAVLYGTWVSCGPERLPNRAPRTCKAVPLPVEP
ncbi:hypothetical protein D3C79_1061590 [compost metagenome]